MSNYRATAQYVLRRYYAAPMLDLIHPGNLGALPPSPRAIADKAYDLGLLSSEHRWIVAYL